MSVEIYICKAGQSLKQGKVEYADIDNRAEAESDAKYRCNADSSIAKIAYYTVSPDGDFRCIYTHQGDAVAVTENKPAKTKVHPRKKKGVKKKTFWQRLFGR